MEKFIFCALQIWSHLLNKSLMENFIFLCSEKNSLGSFLEKIILNKFA